MRTLSKLLPPAALAVCAALAAGASANAETMAQGAPKTADVAIALRAQWLAHGHTVQQMATVAPPTITGGKVDASTITIGQAGQFPSLSLTYATDTPGLSFVSVEFTSPNKQTVYGGGYATPYYTQSGTLHFAIVTPLSLYAAPGTWTLAGVAVYDNAGNSTVYTPAQVHSLFKARTFTVVNSGPAATAAPKILSGNLMNTTVSLSERLPLLKATITASDRAGPGIYQAYVQVQPPGATYSFYSYLPNTAPIKAGKIVANTVFGSYSTTGTWTIVGYGVCDYAFNCSGSTSDADVVALFGTDSFTVTP